MTSPGLRSLGSLIRRGIRVGAIATLGLAALMTVGYLTPRQWSGSSERACDADLASNSSVSQDVTIYVSGDAVHTNLIVPAQITGMDWQQHLDFTQLGQDRRDDYQFLSIGWGDRQFYMTTPTLQDLKLSTTLRAMLWPTDTVLHIQGYDRVPEGNSSYQVQPLRISQADYLALTDFIMASFARDDADAPVLVQESHRYTGSFFAAQGLYSILRTCNDWTAAGLRQAQVNTPLWSGLASSIFHHVHSPCETER